MSSWVPIESNPEVMSKFLHKLGVPSKWNIVDVYGLEPDLLAVVPRPVLAVILLYPDTIKGPNKEDKGESKGSEVAEAQLQSIFHLKQCVPNACGTVALIHSIANNTDTIKLEDGFLKKFLDETRGLSFEEKGELLINAQNVIDTHKDAAQEGQTEAPSEDAPVYHHFVAFVQKDGTLYELDGRKPAPVNHGPSAPDTFLEDAARVCKDYMARDPDEVRFTVVALAGNE